MKQDALNQLEAFVNQLEILADNRDLLLEEMMIKLATAELQGFDRDGLITVLLCRFGELDPSIVKNQIAMKYMHALGDLDGYEAAA